MDEHGERLPIQAYKPHLPLHRTENVFAALYMSLAEEDNLYSYKTRPSEYRRLTAMSHAIITIVHLYLFDVPQIRLLNL